MPDIPSGQVKKKERQIKKAFSPRHFQIKGKNNFSPFSSCFDSCAAHLLTFYPGRPYPPVIRGRRFLTIRTSLKGRNERELVVDVWPICKASPPLLTTGRPSQLAKKKKGVDNNKLENSLSEETIQFGIKVDCHLYYFDRESFWPTFFFLYFYLFISYLLFKAVLRVRQFRRAVRRWAILGLLQSVR